MVMVTRIQNDASNIVILKPEARRYSESGFLLVFRFQIARTSLLEWRCGYDSLQGWRIKYRHSETWGTKVFSTHHVILKP